MLSTPSIQFHKHSLSPCFVPNPGLDNTGEMVVTTTALVLPSQDSQSSHGDEAIPLTVRTQEGQDWEWGSQGTPNPA